VLDLLEGRFQFLAGGPQGGNAVKPYPLIEDLVRPGWRVEMPRAPRMHLPGGTMHVVAQGNGELLRILNFGLEGHDLQA
jgi:hypothetical protein